MITTPLYVYGCMIGAFTPNLLEGMALVTADVVILSAITGRTLLDLDVGNYNE